MCKNKKPELSSMLWAVCVHHLVDFQICLLTDTLEASDPHDH